MNVRELIATLEQLPPDLIVGAYDSDSRRWEEAEGATIEKVRHNYRDPEMTVVYIW